MRYKNSFLNCAKCQESNRIKEYLECNKRFYLRYHPCLKNGDYIMSFIS